MAANSRFAIGIHTLGVLAFVGDKPVSSEMIAKSVDTNPVVIRRIIRNFVRNGLVTVQMGSGGGSTLTKDPGDISLAEIYLALEEDELFQVPQLASDHECPIGRVVRPVLTGIFGGIETLMVDSLRGTSLKDIINIVGEKMKCDGVKGG